MGERLRGAVRALDEERVPRPDRSAGRGALRRSVSEFVRHYRFERNHHGLANALIESMAEPSQHQRSGPATSAARRVAQLLRSGDRVNALHAVSAHDAGDCAIFKVPHERGHAPPGAVGSRDRESPARPKQDHLVKWVRRQLDSWADLGWIVSLLSSTDWRP